MGDHLNEVILKLRANRRAARRYAAIMVVLALLTTITVSWRLHQVGTALTTDNEYFCGYEAHVHTDECYTEELICGYEEGEPEQIDAAFGVDPEPAAEPDVEPEQEAEPEPDPEPQYEVHHHDDSCYEEVTELTCTEDEHTHDELCVDPDTGEYVCGYEEHTHDDSCYTTEKKLICGYEEGEEIPVEPSESGIAAQEMENTAPVVVDDAESEPSDSLVVSEPKLHHHTADCYEKVLTCTIPEHEHTLECLADYTADRESKDDWEEQAAGLSSFWNDAMVEIAQKQLGYTESEKNFTVDEGIGENLGTAHHYTRYGAWYGNPYGDWDVMFVAFCQYYAGIPEDVIPQRAGLDALRADMSKRGFAYLYEGGEAAAPGDIVTYYNSNGDETVGIVEEIDDETGIFTVISGAVDGAVAEVPVDLTSITSTICVDSAYAEYAGAADDDGGRGRAITLEGDDTTPAVQTTQLDNAWITDAAIKEWLDDGTGKKNWVPVSEVTEGDNIQVSISYTVPDGIITSSNKKLQYQLPDGIDIVQVNGQYPSGKITTPDGSEEIGTYTIDENGLVTFEFCNDFAEDGKGFSGTFDFQASVTQDSSTSTKEINFGGKTTSVTIEEKQHEKDISVWKEGSFKKLENGKALLHYKVIASSSYGTDGLVKFEDALKIDQTNAKGTYKEGSFTLSKVSNGTAEPAKSVNPTITTNGNARSFVLDNLPALGKNEQYILEYDVEVTLPDITTTFPVGNSVKASGGTKYDEKDTSTNVYGAKLSKWGEFKADGNNGKGSIEWHIVVENPYNLDLTGQTVKDILPVGYTIIEDVTVQGDSWINNIIGPISAADFTKNGYTFKAEDDTKNHKKFDFKVVTDVPDNVKNGDVVTNNASFGNSTAGGTATVGRRDWGISKSRNGDLETDDSGVERASWSVSVDIPSDWDTFTMTDTITANDASNNALSDVHYALLRELKKEIEENLQLELTTGTKKFCEGTNNKVEGVSYSVKYYNKDGNEVTSDDAHVTRFEITLTNGNEITTAKKLTLNGYHTILSKSAMQDGDEWTFKNTAEIPGKETSASYTEKKSGDFTKWNGYIGQYNKNVQFDETKQEVNYNWQEGYLYYQLLFKVTPQTKCPIIVTDILPEGAVFDEACEEYAINNVGYVNSGTDNVNTSLWDNAGHQYIYKNYFSVKTTQEAGRTKVEFTLQAKEENGVQYHPCIDGKTHLIAIRYKVNVKNDPRWDTVSKDENHTGSLEYVNEASWGDDSASTKVTVDRTFTNLEKSGTQIVDGNGKTTKVRYQVVINPTGEKLLQTSNELTLEDVLDVQDNGVSYSVSLDVDSVRLYTYLPSDTDLTQAKDITFKIVRLSSGKNSYGNDVINVTVPDGLACVLVYDYNVDYPAGQTITLKNHAYLNGKDDVWEYTDTRKYSSIATASKTQFTLHKVDEDNNLISLAGAEFKLSRYDQNSKNWVECATVTTDASGQYVFRPNDNVGTYALGEDVLYKLEETKAPTGYTKTDQVYYFLWGNSKDTIITAYKAATSQEYASNGTLGVGTETIANSEINYFASGTSGSWYAKNKASSIVVKKQWVDENGAEIKDENEMPNVQVKVQLWRKSSDGTTEQVPNAEVILDKSNNWTASWENLPEGYTYFVVEEDATNLKDYVNNGGITTGVIRIVNKKPDDTGYELPSTGSTGTTQYTAGGALIMGAALVCGYLTKRRRGRRAE